MTIYEAIDYVKDINRTVSWNEDQKEDEIFFDNVADWLEELKCYKKCDVGRWIPVSERLPELHELVGEYICQSKNGTIDICGFTNDAYFLDKYDFAKYKGQKKKLFYEYDSEFGYYEVNVVAWMPLPRKYKKEV